MINSSIDMQSLLFSGLNSLLTACHFLQMVFDMTAETAEQCRANYFDHERWDVYRAALEFIIVVKHRVEALPRGNADLTDQLQRACTSIPLNIAEGA